MDASRNELSSLVAPPQHNGTQVHRAARLLQLSLPISPQSPPTSTQSLAALGYARFLFSSSFVSTSLSVVFWQICFIRLSTIPLVVGSSHHSSKQTPMERSAAVLRGNNTSPIFSFARNTVGSSMKPGASDISLLLKRGILSTIFCPQAVSSYKLAKANESR